MATIKRRSNTANGITKQHDPYYDTAQWRRKRRVFFSIPSNKLCYYCGKKGKASIAFILDHQLSRKLFPELEEEDSNYKGACRSCDQTKRKIEGQCHDRSTLIKRLGEGGFYP